jgi:RNA recognition motif-containing protein
VKIYVGNLSWGTTEDDLQSAFGAFGQVGSVSIIKDKYSGQSRGFGFVEMDNAEQANQAISALNEKEMDGRNLTVNEARPRTEDRRGSHNSYDGYRR